MTFSAAQYSSLVSELTSCQARLVEQGGDWGLHRLDQAIFSYHVLR